MHACSGTGSVGQVCPDGDPAEDVYAVLRDAIPPRGKLVVSRVCIARRERAVAIIPMGHGLVMHTLHEERDLNNDGEVFDRLPDGKTDSEMAALATQRASVWRGGTLDAARASPPQRTEIIARAESGQGSPAQLANLFPVSRSTVQHVLREHRTRQAIG